MVTKKDVAGQVLQTVTYEYDANHNLIGLTDPNGHRKRRKERVYVGEVKEAREFNCIGISPAIPNS